MTEAIFRRRVAAFAGEAGLFPVDEESATLLGGIKLGRDVGCDVIQRRNPRHHRLYWAMVKFVSMHCPLFEDVPLEKIHVSIKLATGLVDTFVDVATGNACYVPRSIAFAAMSQDEFNPFFDDACKVIAGRWMPEGVTPESVRDELLLMVDGPHALRERRA